MGFNTTVVIMNDSLSAIRDDENFGKNLYNAILALSTYPNKTVDVPAMSNVNAATVIEQHHADQCAVVTVGGNYGNVLGMVHTYQPEHHTDEAKLKIIRAIAKDMGYVVRKHNFKDK